MKKNNFILLIILLLFTTTSFSQMQSQYLPIGNRYIKYNQQGTSSSVNNLPINNPENAPTEYDANFISSIGLDWFEYTALHYVGQGAKAHQAIVYDYLSDCTPDDILFFIVDNNIYNKDGISIDANYTPPPNSQTKPLVLFESASDVFFSNPILNNNTYHIQPYQNLTYDEVSRTTYYQSCNLDPMLTNGLIVVPDPNNCYEFFLIYNMHIGNAGTQQDGRFFYRKLYYHDKNNISLSDIVIMKGGAAGNGLYNMLASEYRSDINDFYIFVTGNGNKTEVYKLSDLNNFLNNPVNNAYPSINTIFNFDVNKQQGQAYSLAGSYNFIQAEYECKIVTENNNNKYYYISQTLHHANGYSPDCFYFYKLNFNTLDIVQNEIVWLPQGIDNTAISGAEFSPDGKTFYFTYKGQTGINYISTDFLENNTTPGSINILPINNPEYFEKTYIELARDNNLYFVNSDNNVLWYLSNPNNPNINNWTNTNITVTPPAIPNSLVDHYFFENQIDGEFYSNYVNIHPIDRQCCISHVKEFEYDDHYNQIIIDQGNVVWDGINNPINSGQNILNIEHDIIVKDGASLQIKNLTVKFNENTGIIVGDANNLNNNSNTKLTVYNSTLTSFDSSCCGQLNIMWKGIKAYGNDTPHNNGNESRVIISNSTLENAYLAVNSWNGAVISASNSNFRNNQYGVSAYWNNSKNSMFNRIVNCNFNTDGPLNNPNITAKNYVSIGNINKFNFINNTFVDNTNSFSIDGILTWNCKNINVFNIGSHHNRFVNLKYGIMAWSVPGYNLNNAEFINNIKGARFINCDNIKLINNNFDVYDQTFNSSNGNEVYGASIESSTGYTIQNNQFHDGIAGLYVINSGINENEVRHNQFYNLQGNGNETGVIAQDINGSEPCNDDLCTTNNGLRILCNKFTNNDYNIANIDGIIRIKQYNDNDNKPANNWFSQHQESSYTGFDFYVENPIYSEEIIYFQNGENNEADELLLDWDNDPYSSNPITHNDAGDYYTYPNGVDISLDYTERTYDTWENACPDEYPTGGGSIDPIGVVISKIDNNKTDADNKKDELDAKIDGGNTMALQNEVDNLTQQNYFNTCADLLDVGPYLSNGVLTSFMDNQIYRPVAKTIVLMANSPLPFAAKQKIDDVNIPPFFKYYLKQLQNGTYQREQDEMEIESLLSGNEKLLNKTIGSALSNDTVPEKLDSIVTWLEGKNDLKSYYRLVPIYINQGEYNKATIALEALLAEAQTIGGTTQETAENYKTITLINIAIAQTPENKNEIIKANIPKLEKIAEGEGKQAGIARYMLYNYNKEQFASYKQNYLLPNTNKSLALQPNKPTETYTGEKPDAMISVYPNPTDGQLNVEYINFANAKTINIYDLKGSIVMSFNANKDFGFNTIDVSSLQKGTYLIGFGQKQTTKFIVK